MKKNKITGLIGTAVLHILLLILLLVIAIRRPQVQEEGGVPRLPNALTPGLYPCVLRHKPYNLGRGKSYRRSVRRLQNYPRIQ